ncbi:hypothetical protein QTP88_008953 [Uroleucon formosanum]
MALYLTLIPNIRYICLTHTIVGVFRNVVRLRNIILLSILLFKRVINVRHYRKIVVIVIMSAGSLSLMVIAPLVLRHVTVFACSAQRHCSGRSRRNATSGGGGLTRTGAQYRDDSRYLLKNNIALRAQICGNDLNLAYPRRILVVPLRILDQTESNGLWLRSGVPATVATTCLFTADACSEAVMTSYSCLSNAVDLYLDGQEVLWILDTGVVQMLDNNAKPLRKGQPTVWGLDFTTTKRDGKCCVYATDAANRATIACDVAESKGARVDLPETTVAGCTKRDVLYAALVRAECGDGDADRHLPVGRQGVHGSDRVPEPRFCRKSDGLGRRTGQNVILGTGAGSKLFFRYDGSPDVQKWEAALSLVVENFSPSIGLGPASWPTQVMADRDRNRLMVVKTNFPDFAKNIVGCGIVHNVQRVTLLVVTLVALSTARRSMWRVIADDLCYLQSLVSVFETTTLKQTNDRLVLKFKTTFDLQSQASEQFEQSYEQKRWCEIRKCPLWSYRRAKGKDKRILFCDELSDHNPPAVLLTEQEDTFDGDNYDMQQQQQPQDPVSGFRSSKKASLKIGLCRRTTITKMLLAFLKSARRVRYEKLLKVTVKPKCKNKRGGGSSRCETGSRIPPGILLVETCRSISR